MSLRINKALRKARKQLFDELADTRSKTYKLMLAEIGAVDAHQAGEHFATEGKSSGQEWEDSGNPKYPPWKKREVGSKKKLAFKGRLRDSLRHMSHKDHVARIKGRSAFFGTSVPYARDHHEGRSVDLRKRGDIGKRLISEVYHKPVIQLPKRPVIRKTKEDAKTILQRASRVFVRRADEITKFQVLTNAARKSWAQAGRAARGFSA